MMAMSEEQRGGQMILKIIGTAALGILFAYSLGMAAGTSEALLEGRGGTLRVLRLAGALIVSVGCVWGVMRLKPWARSGEPVAERTRKANKLLLLACSLGGVLGAVLAIGAFRMEDPFAFLSNGPMPLAVVIPAIGIWLIAMLLSLQWHRSVDEHEARAYEFGGLAGLYLYSMLAPAWWLAWRGGLLPPPDTMVIFLAVMAVWSIVWFWRRYR